jgi:hypothetical protein
MKKYIFSILITLLTLNLSYASISIDAWGVNNLKAGKVFIPFGGTTAIDAWVNVKRTPNYNSGVYISPIVINGDGSVQRLGTIVVGDGSFNGNLLASLNFQFNVNSTLEGRRIYIASSENADFSNYSIFPNTNYATLVQPDPSAFDPIPSHYDYAFLNYNTAISATDRRFFPNNNTPVLTAGQSLFSTEGNTQMILQTDGNLVIYKRGSNGVQTAVWASNTTGRQVGALYYQTDGNLVLYSGTATNQGPAIWSSNIAYIHGETAFYPYYSLQDDGNLVLNWPANYLRDGNYLRVNVIMACSDSQVGASAHFGNLNHTLWGNDQKARGNEFNR